jgi:hypothetical protein
MSREWTEDEIREKFLAHVRVMVDYWDREPRAETQKRRLEGLAFSILVALDGCAGGLPGFIVAPSPHPEDKAFHQSEGENYYPENHEADVKGDIAGCLHELFYKKP